MDGSADCKYKVSGPLLKVTLCEFYHIMSQSTNRKQVQVDRCIHHTKFNSEHYFVFTRSMSHW